MKTKTFESKRVQMVLIDFRTVTASVLQTPSNAFAVYLDNGTGKARGKTEYPTPEQANEQLNKIVDELKKHSLSLEETTTTTIWY